MNDINNVSLTGRLIKDCEAKQLQNTNLINFTVAVNGSRKVGNEWQDEASFIDCTYFSKSGNIVSFLTKGKQIALQGALQQDKWEKDGQKFSKIKIMVNQLVLIGGNGNSQPQAQQNSQPENADEIPW